MLKRSPGRLNVAELGLYDPVDTFWSRRPDFLDASLSRSEQDLLDQRDYQSVPHHPEALGASEAVSYEDLMDFALDGPRHRYIATMTVMI